MGAKRVDVPSVSESPDSPKSQPPVDTGKIEAGMKQVNEVKSREAHDNVLTRDSGDEYTREYFEKLSKDNPNEYSKILDKLMQSGASPDKVKVLIDRGGFNINIGTTIVYSKRNGEPGTIVE